MYLGLGWSEDIPNVPWTICGHFKCTLALEGLQTFQTYLCLGGSAYILNVPLLFTDISDGSIVALSSCKESFNGKGLHSTFEGYELLSLMNTLVVLSTETATHLCTLIAIWPFCRNISCCDTG